MTRHQRVLGYVRHVERTRDYQALLDLAEDAIVITDAGLERPGPIITFANAAFERMSGYRRDELVGRTPRLLQGAYTDPAELARMRRALLAGEVFEGEVLNYRRGHGEYIVAWLVAPVRDRAGTVTGWLSLQNDVGQELLGRRTQQQDESPGFSV